MRMRCIGIRDQSEKARLAVDKKHIYLDYKQFEIYSSAVTDLYTFDETNKIRRAKHLLANLWKYYSE